MVLEKQRKYKDEIYIHFDQADPAGILFFGNFFHIAHRSIEKFLSSIQISWEEWFSRSYWGTPIRQARAEYFHPLYVAKSYQVDVFLRKLGTSSLHFEVQFFEKETLCSRVFITFVFISFKTKKKISIPKKIREKLEFYLEFK